MKLYLYDFDGTIYAGDSSVDFFLFCMKKEKRIFFHSFKMIIPLIKYKLGKICITDFKEIVFSYLNKIKNIDDLVKEFWIKNKYKIKKYYLDKDHKNDIIISASPYFLLKPICDELKVKDLIASSVDKHTGKFNKPNCKGLEKVKEFKFKYPSAEIMEMYSDSFHDKPLLDLAKKSYLVKGNKIYDYKTYNPNLFKKIWDLILGIYNRNKEIWNYLIVGVFTTVVSIGSYALFSKGLNINYILSNILSWIAAVIFAYVTNRSFVFKSKNKDIIKEAFMFISSRLLTLIMDTLLMILFVELIKIDDLISKIVVQIFVVVANYVISKLFVFKKE